MRKLLAVVLFAAAMVAPAFAAEKGEISIIPKIGIQPEATFNLDYDGPSYMSQYDLNTMYVFDLEAFYSVSNIFSVGAGVSFPTVKSITYFAGDIYLRTIAYYLAVKAETPVSITEKSSVYAIGKIGLNNMDVQQKNNPSYSDSGSGLYFALGAGLDINNIIFEASYSVSKASIDKNSCDVLKLSALKISAGYKFSI
jgi:opacity protein-like surface antigen